MGKSETQELEDLKSEYGFEEPKLDAVDTFLTRFWHDSRFSNYRDWRCTNLQINNLEQDICRLFHVLA